MVLKGIITGLFITTTYAAPAHFFIQAENRSDKNASLSFQQDVGNIYLDPIMNEHTNIAAHALSTKYGVHIEPLDPKASFNIIFTGKQDCTFNIGFYGPGNPKVTVSGAGCYGGGYEIIDNGTALLLYISDIHKK